MDKIAMREYVADVEALIDKKLRLWKKLSKIENGEVVHLSWQFEQTIVIIDFFWLDGDEGANVQVIHPRRRYQFEFSGLNAKTIGELEDRIGNVTQTIMYRSPHGK